MSKNPIRVMKAGVVFGGAIAVFLGLNLAGFSVENRDVPENYEAIEKRVDVHAQPAKVVIRDLESGQKTGTAGINAQTDQRLREARLENGITSTQ